MSLSMVALRRAKDEILDLSICLENDQMVFLTLYRDLIGIKDESNIDKSKEKVKEMIGLLERNVFKHVRVGEFRQEELENVSDSDCGSAHSISTNSSDGGHNIHRDKSNK